jgi:hypothetical protein
MRSGAIVAVGALGILAGCGVQSRCPNGKTVEPPGVSPVVILHGADDVRSFAGCTRVKGSLEIGSESLTTLAGLESLTTIDGSFTVGPNTALTSLAGLEGLASIGGLVRFTRNAVLTDISALSGLTEIPADLLIDENPALTTLSLPGLTSVGALGLPPNVVGISTNQLYVARNNALSRFDLPALRFVGGSLTIYDNTALAKCQVDALAAQLGKTCDCDRNTGTGTCN